MKKKTTYTKITAKIILSILIVTLLSSFIYGEYMKRNAISHLAQIDAKKTSMLVFESLYSAMQRGWTKEDLNEIIARLNRVDEKMHVDVYRSPVVARLFGDIKKDRQVRTSDPDIINAMQGNEQLKVSDSEYIDYFYPVIAKNDCLRCHTNAQVGDTLGVINVSYPVENLKVSLSEMINFFIIFILLFSLVTFLAIFMELDKYLLKPIKNFSQVIQNITQSHDVTKRVSVDDDIEELDSIKNVFNQMLDSIEYQFYYDDLTGLENRRGLIEQLELREHTFLAIINIDAFQEINDLYGEEAGDILLKEFAKFLKRIIPAKHGHLYRLHSDEFAFLCRSGSDIDEFLTFIAFLGEKIARKTFNINGKSEINLRATIGISHGTEMLLANADIALKLAKKSKKNFLVYDSSMQMEKEYEKNFEWTKRLKNAIKEDRIVPVFQPIIDTKTGKTVKYEALMRMVDNKGELIAPIHFLDLAKKNKLYHELTKVMIEKSFRSMQGLEQMLSINISVEDILNKDVSNFIVEQLKKQRVGPGVAFELIESEGIENFEAVLDFIDTVKAEGAKISIDDFGTGYSNFEYLMKLKVDYIKIDGSIIKNIDTDTNAETVTKTIIRFAQEMGIKTVAEFVYSKNIYDKIAELEVDYAQGYYFGEPSRTFL